MSYVLDYAPQRTAWRFPRGVVPILLAFAHISLCWHLSGFMLLAVCEHNGANFTAWTPLAWVPGAVVANLGARWSGVWAMALSSLLAGWALEQIVLKHAPQQWKWESLVRDWRVWGTAALWLAWFPVPAPYAFIYHFSMWATRN